MNLLKNISYALLLIPLVTMNAQSDVEEMELFQSMFGIEKRAMYNEFIKAEGEPATEFWRLYDDYEKRRKTYAQKRLNLLDNYVDNYDNHTPEQLDLMMRNLIQQKSNMNRLIDGYYKKMRKSSGSKIAAQFWQMENYILSASRITIMETIPFIGELEEEE